MAPLSEIVRVRSRHIVLSFACRHCVLFRAYTCQVWDTDCAQVLDYYDVADQVHVSTGNNQASGMVRLRAKRSALEAARLAEARRPPDDSQSSATVQKSERGSR